MMILTVTLLSCSTESDLNGESQVAVKFNPVNSFTSTQAITKDNQLKQSTSGALKFTDGYIAISRLEFEVETENDSIEREFELEQNTIIDFPTGGTTPDIGNITIPAGTYEEVEVEIELRENSEEPAILLNGVFTSSDGVEHPIRFEFNSKETFEVEREGVIVLEENQVAITQITFDPILWFANITEADLGNVTADSEGVVVISATQNTEIFDKVADGLELASEVEVGDDDGQDEDNDEI